MTPDEINEKLSYALDLRRRVRPKEIGIWSPTENIADAWDVVEAMRLKGWHVLVNGDPPDYHGREDWPAPFHACFCPPGLSYDRDRFHAHADSFPMAICQAALRALDSQDPANPVRDKTDENLT
jgi:hypothetical protein